MANKAISTLAVGSSVYLNVGGVRKEFLVVHQGLPSSMYDASCNGTWLLMKDIYENRKWHSSNVNKYETSDINTYLNGPFFNLFDSNIKDAIKQVKLPYRKGGGSGGTDQTGENGLQCKIFLLSAYELGWTQSNYNSKVPIDGEKLDYFVAGSDGNTKRIANYNGAAKDWWMRSPTDSANLVYSTISNGYMGYYNASTQLGIRPALVLSSDALVDDSGNVVIPDLTAHKTLINGTAYTIKGGKCMVNGTVYNIKKGRTLIDGTGYDITFKPLYDPVFANNTWEQIIAACHNNDVPETWKVADQKSMTIGGVDYLIDIIGKNHDDYSDGSGKAPLTFQLHDCYGKQRMNNSNTNIGGWTSCAMRNTHLPAILSLMPTEVQNGIREVNKLTSAGSQSATINTTADKLFLLSEIEIFGSVSYSKSGEGTQYDYYKAGNSRVKKFNGSAISWWERSPHGSTSTPFCCVYINGAAATYGYASNAYGVAFGFCF